MDAVIQCRVPNCRGARIPLHSSFDWDYLKRNIVDCHDKALIDYLIFGFPLGLFSSHDIRSNATDNHSSARDFGSAIDEYIQTEINEGALLGPFKDPPHPNYTWSPLTTGGRVIE